jgi:chaperonin cofactor prefoldin
MKIKDKVKSILADHPLNDNQKLDKWIEEVFVHFYQEIKEEQEEKLDQKADKIDIKLLIERNDEKFLALQKEMNTRFEAMNVRFETLQKEMNTRFEAMNVRFETLQKEMNTRFEAINVRFETLQKEMNTRFEAVHKEMNARFEAVEKRFNAVQWMIGVGFTLLAIMMTLSNFIKK